MLKWWKNKINSNSSESDSLEAKSQKNKENLNDQVEDIAKIPNDKGKRKLIDKAQFGGILDSPSEKRRKVKGSKAERVLGLGNDDLRGFFWVRCPDAQNLGPRCPQKTRFLPSQLKSPKPKPHQSTTYQHHLLIHPKQPSPYLLLSRQFQQSKSKEFHTFV